MSTQPFRVVARSAVLAAGVFVIACSGLLGIEERESRPPGFGPDGGPTGTGMGATGGGMGSGGAGASTPGAGGGAPIAGSPGAPSSCTSGGSVCSDCLCSRCPDVRAECDASGANCDPIVECVVGSGCGDPQTCERVCAQVAEQQGNRELALRVGECLGAGDCPGCGTAVADCVDQGNSGPNADTPEVAECWGCACSQCGASGELGVCSDGQGTCTSLAACMVGNGCSDAACGAQCDPTAPIDLLDPVARCFTERCSEACGGLPQIPSNTDVRAQCRQRYGTGGCWQCACDQCDDVVLQTCTQAGVDCSGVMTCLLTSGCSGTSCEQTCASPDAPQSVINGLSDCLNMQCPGCSPGTGGPEICNFADDDGNGAVDEGFQWLAHPWMTLVNAPENIGLMQAAFVPNDGGAAVYYVLGPGSADERAMVATVSPDGAINSGPMEASTNGVISGLAAASSDTESAGLFGTVPRCGATGCNGLAWHIDGAGGASEFDVTFAETPGTILGLTTYSNGFVAAITEASGFLEMRWLDFAQPAVIAQSAGWPETITRGTMDAVGSTMVLAGYSAGGAPGGTVWLGAYDRETGAETGFGPIMGLGAGTDVAEGRSVAMLSGTSATGNTVGVLYQANGAPWMVTVGASAPTVILKGPYALASPGTPWEVIDVGGAFATLVHDGNANLTVEGIPDNLDTASYSMPTVDLPSQGGTSPSYSMVKIDQGLLIFEKASMGLTSEIRVARILCN